MIEYQVLGYNKNDYMTNIVGWELLKIFDNRDSAEEYMSSLESYECKLVECEHKEQSNIIGPTDDVHWEIYTGV